LYNKRKRKRKKVKSKIILSIQYIMSDVIWFNKPLVILNENHLYEIIPKNHMSKNRKINAISRLIIIVTSLLFIITGKFSYLISGIVSLGLIYIITFNKKEGFAKKNKKKATKIKSVEQSTNPLDNAMIGGNNDKEASSNAYGEENIETINTSVKKMIQEQNSSIDDINSKLFNDLGENLEFDRSMRQFYTTASTTIPNDQQGFADFCYKDMTSGKEGNESALLKNSIHLHTSHL